MSTQWNIVNLGSICDYSRGLTYKKSDQVEWSRNPVLRANNVDREKGAIDLSDLRYISDDIQIPDSKKIREGTLLVCTASGSKSHLGKAALVTEAGNYAFGGFMGLLEPHNTLDAKYLHWLLQSDAYREFIDELAAGVNINNLKFSQLSNLQVPLPPLPEQKRIVAILDEAFGAIAKAKENAEKNIANARELFDSYLNRVFADRGEGWEEKTLPEICENLDKKRKPITKSKRVLGAVPYYGASGVVDHVEGHLFDEPLLLISEDGANLLARTYPIAFSISGKAWVNNHAHVLRFPTSGTRIFVGYYLNSISLEPWVSGMAQPKLNQSKLNTIPVPIAPPKQEAKILQGLGSLREETERVVENYRQRIVALNELKQSLLQKAFSGQLTSKSPELELVG